MPAACSGPGLAVLGECWLGSRPDVKGKSCQGPGGSENEQKTVPNKTPSSGPSPRPRAWATGSPGSPGTCQESRRPPRKEHCGPARGWGRRGGRGAAPGSPRRVVPGRFPLLIRSFSASKAYQLCSLPTGRRPARDTARLPVSSLRTRKQGRSPSCRVRSSSLGGGPVTPKTHLGHRSQR